MQHTEIIGHCPICNEKLIATKLTCKHCGLELTNNFTLNKFNYLTYEDFQFIDNFLKYRGNLKDVMESMNLSYPATKKKLNQVLEHLGYNTSSSNPDMVEVIVETLPIYKDESIIVKSIKKKLNASKGLAKITLTNQNTFSIYYEEFENGIYATNLPKRNLLSWKAFDCVLTLLQESGGRAPKGNAMKAKLGDKGLTLDTIEGYVAYHAYNVALGDSVLRRISAISSILEWCGVCKNGYGYLELVDMTK